MTPDFGRLGFGFLRLPLKDPDKACDVDMETTAQMVDLFLEKGFRYFDTAYTYLEGMSEAAIRKTLVERHPRESFMLASKLPCGVLKRGKTAEEIFGEQILRCGVDYFDVYLLHGLDGEDADFAHEQGCFDFLQELKRRGKARLTGFSFHDTAEVLDRILTAHPEVDVVQIQLNYLDWDNPIIQSAACLGVCRKHGKPVIVMEPVKGGTLADIPEKAAVLFGHEAPAHRALRFAASQPGVALVLSGMSTVEQVLENARLMGDFEALTALEYEQLHKAADIIRSAVAIPCTGCAYCIEVCPAALPIPRYFTLYNERERDGWQANTEDRYARLLLSHPAAECCIGCKSCEQSCPQKLDISGFMKRVSDVFDRKTK